MSRQGHLRAARRERQEARKHENKYDPKAKRTRVRRVIGDEHGPHWDVGFDYSVEQYNPTANHLQQAKLHRTHARQHEAAARALMRYEAGVCRRFPSRVRAVCPLLGQVRKVQQIPGGVRLHLKADVNQKAVVDHMRCHFAFGRTRGRAGMKDCPLYLKGIHIRPVKGKPAVDIVGKGPAVVKEIRRRAQTHVAP